MKILENYEKKKLQRDPGKWKKSVLLGAEKEGEKERKTKMQQIRKKGNVKDRMENWIIQSILKNDYNIERQI